MKNLTRIPFFALAVLFLVSCGDDPKPTLNLVGKWSIESTTADLEVDGKPLKDYLIASGKTAAEAQAIVDEFNGQISVDVITGTFEFKSDGSFTGLTKDGDGNDDSISGTWKLSDDKKTVTITDSASSGDPETLTVADFTDTTVTLKELVETDNSMGVKLDFYIVLKLKKA